MSGIIGGAGSKSGVIGQTELDYEEGTWTPTFLMSTTQVASYSDQYGHYVRIGDLVHISCSCWCNNKGSAAGALAIAGIPFDVYGATAAPSTGQIYLYNIGMGSHKIIYCIASQNATTIGVNYNDESSGSGTPTNVSVSGMGTYPAVMFGMTYRIKSKII